MVEAQWSENLGGGNMVGGGCMCIGCGVMMEVMITWCCGAGGMFGELGLGLETLMVRVR
jgi:hypothetical protein